MRKDFWAPEWHDALVELIGEKLSASRIAQEMTERFGRPFTRNAIIGRANRHKLSVQSAPSWGGKGRAGVCKPRGAIVHKEKQAMPGTPLTSLDLPALDESRAQIIDALRDAATDIVSLFPAVPVGLTIIELPYLGACKYPTGVNEDGMHLFCGASIDAATVYCDCHAQLAYTPTTPSQRRRWTRLIDRKARRAA